MCENEHSFYKGTLMNKTHEDQTQFFTEKKYARKTLQSKQLVSSTKNVLVCLNIDIMLCRKTFELR